MAESRAVGSDSRELYIGRFSSDTISRSLAPSAGKLQLCDRIPPPHRRVRTVCLQCPQRRATRRQRSTAILCHVQGFDRRSAVWLLFTMRDDRLTLGARALSLGIAP